MTVERYFVNRDRELRIFHRMVAGQEPRRILDVCADGGQGKSYLLRQIRTESRAGGVPCALIEFAPNWQPDPLKLMRELAERLGDEHFAGFRYRDATLHGQPSSLALADDAPPPGVSMEGNFTGARVENVAGGSIHQTTVDQRRPPTAQERERLVWELAQIFCRELTALAADFPVALLFDAWEHVPGETADWIVHRLLRPMRDGERGRLVVVLAGQPAGPRPFEPWGDWRGIVVRCNGFDAFELEAVRRYFLEKRGLPLAEGDVQAYYRAVCSKPKLMGNIADELEERQW